MGAEFWVYVTASTQRLGPLKKEVVGVGAVLYCTVLDLQLAAPVR